MDNLGGFQGILANDIIQYFHFGSIFAMLSMQTQEENITSYVKGNGNERNTDVIGGCFNMSGTQPKSIYCIIKVKGLMNGNESQAVMYQLIAH